MNDQVFQDNDLDYVSLLSSMPNLVLVLNADGDAVKVNDNWLEWRGRTAERELGEKWLLGVHPEDREFLESALLPLAAVSPCQVDFRLANSTGIYREMHAYVSPWMMAGEQAGLILSCIDATDEHRRERKIRRSESLHRMALNTLTDGVIIRDSTGKLLMANDSGGYDTLGMSGAVLYASPNYQGPVEDVWDENNVLVPFQDRPVNKVLREEEPVLGQLLSWRTPDGVKKWFRVDSVPVFSTLTGALSSIVTSLSDFTDMRHDDEETKDQAEHDDLTGLATRLSIMSTIKGLSERVTRTGSDIAVAFADLDDFKAVNDTLGHAAGDELLCTVSARIESAVRKDDTVARLGGDEMVIVLDSVNGLAGALEACESIRSVVQQPMQLSGETVTVSVSLGVTLLVQGEDPETAVNRADEAMYQAKESGRNRTVAV